MTSFITTLYLKEYNNNDSELIKYLLIINKNRRREIKKKTNKQSIPDNPFHVKF